MANSALLLRDHGLLRSVMLVVLWIFGSINASFATPITIGATYQDNALSGCPGAPAINCAIDFALVPANKQLVLTNVTCQITLSTNAVITRIALQVLTAANGTTQHANTLVPVQVGANGVNRNLVINHPILQLVRSNLKPRVVVFLSQGDIFLLGCNVMGTITDAPPI